MEKLLTQITMQRRVSGAHELSPLGVLGNRISGCAGRSSRDNTVIIG